MQRDDFDIRAFNAMAKIRVILDAQNRMPVFGGGHVVDQVDQPVFHPAHKQMMNHVQDQRRAARVHGCPGRSKNFSSGKAGLNGNNSCASWTNAGVHCVL